MAEERISIEVAYAKANEQKIIALEVESGTSLLEAARQSGIKDLFPEIDFDAIKLGIFGKAVPKPAEQSVKPFDRIEIYRPLIADSKEVRKRRAEQAKSKQ